MRIFKSRDIFDAPTLLERILDAPVHYLISNAYKISSILRSSPPTSTIPIRVVCISDTHTKTYSIPAGDVLIHAGDLTNAGSIPEIQAQIDWLASLPHKYKIAIAGNHDTYLDSRSRATLDKSDRAGELDWKGIRYLQHSSTTLRFDTGAGTVRKLAIYGAPQIPLCGGNNFAFQYPRGQDAWSDTIQSDTDILVTHTPPKYHLDLSNPSLGCEWLLKEVWRIKPTLHVFGHVHAGAGRQTVWWDEMQKAYELGCERKSKGFVRGILDVWSWVSLGKVLVYGITGVLWNRVWGGEQKCTIMVNAALMVNNTGKLGNEVQVVEI
jgi:predicted phosphodiesterase